LPIRITLFTDPAIARLHSCSGPGRFLTDRSGS
jgi:hypothetical protein